MKQDSTAGVITRVSLWVSRNWQGVLLCSATAVLCMWASRLVTGFSPLLLAIIIGIVARNTLTIPGFFLPGVSVASKSFLRWGVVLLGLQLSVSTILSLGPGVLGIVVAAVTITFMVTLLLGRVLKVDADLTKLIAAGFSICGAAAIAGMQGVIRAKDEVVAAAVALVVCFGTLMIPVTAALTAALDLSTGSAGTLIGGSVHEVAQVVAAAGIAGGAPLLAIAVPIKLARVVLMAPMVIAVSLASRSSSIPSGQKRPPLIPLFVVGFLVMIIIATLGILPPAIVSFASLCQQFLLTAAMFALGLGVHFRSLLTLGGRPVLLGFLATLVICSVVAGGIALGWGV